MINDEVILLFFVQTHLNFFASESNSKFRNPVWDFYCWSLDEWMNVMIYTCVGTEPSFVSPLSSSPLVWLDYCLSDLMASCRNRDAEARLKRSWKEYFKDPSQWCDNRNSKVSGRHSFPHTSRCNIPGSTIHLAFSRHEYVTYIFSVLLVGLII